MTKSIEEWCDWAESLSSHDPRCATGCVFHKRSIEHECEWHPMEHDCDCDDMADGDGWYEEIAKQRPQTHSIKRPT